MYGSLLKIANTSGSDSTNLKTAIIIKLIQNATAQEAKFIVRYLTKNLKIGANEKTVLSALARAFANTPGDEMHPPKVLSNRKRMGESAFIEFESKLEALMKETICEYPNYTHLIDALL